MLCSCVCGFETGTLTFGTNTALLPRWSATKGSTQIAVCYTYIYTIIQYLLSVVLCCAYPTWMIHANYTHIAFIRCLRGLYVILLMGYAARAIFIAYTHTNVHKHSRNAHATMYTNVTNTALVYAFVLGRRIYGKKETKNTKKTAHRSVKFGHEGTFYRRCLHTYELCVIMVFSINQNVM